MGSYTELLNRFMLEMSVLELNSITFEVDNRIEFLLKVETNTVNPLVSPKEYRNMESFINKVRNRLPLLKRSSENKIDLKEEDFIYY